MSAVTAGIDAIASTRVVINEENNQTTTHLTGGKNARSYRYVYNILYLFLEK